MHAGINEDTADCSIASSDIEASCILFYRVQMYQDSLAVGIKQCDRLKIFKRELKEYILNTIQYF